MNATNNIDEDVLRADLAAAVRQLEDLGLNHGSSGNVSCRLGQKVLITPTGGTSHNIENGRRAVVIGYDGTVEGPGIASSEWQMHAELLAAKPEAGAVVHTHADNCVALSCLRWSIPPFHYMMASFGGEVRCAGYAPFGSQALAKAAVASMGGRSACLLANHGMIVVGKDLRQAVDRAIRLEMLARQYLLASQAGTPVLLSEDEMAEATRRYGYYGVKAMPR